MKRRTGFVLMMLCFQICQAQVKSFGTITDEKGKAISNASLHILNTDVYLVADEAGRFTLPDLPKGKYTLEISAIGFARIEKQVQIPLSDDKLTIPLISFCYAVGCCRG